MPISYSPAACSNRPKVIFRILCLLGLIGWISLFLVTTEKVVAANAQLQEGRLKIVFEVTSGPDMGYEIFMNNIEGLQRNFSTLADIAVVASSHGVDLLRDSDNPLRSRLARLADQGVDFMVCRETLNEFDLEASDIISFARTVPSGNKEIENLKKHGWACVRDGESYVSHL